MNIKNLIAAIVLAAVSLAAHADITDGKFGTGQMFDVQYYWSGTTLNASGFTRVYSSSGQLSTQTYTDMATNNQYFGFFASSTAGQYGLAIYNSNGSVARTLHTAGTMSAIGPDAVFYLGSGFYGTVISTTQGYAFGGNAAFTNMDRSVTTSDLTSYTYTTTTPLAAGQSASSVSTPTAPTVVSTAPGASSVTNTSTSGTTVHSTPVVTYSSSNAVSTDAAGSSYTQTQVALARGVVASGSLAVTKTTTVDTFTPVRNTTVTTTPYTSVVTNTTPVTVTTVTTPSTVTTYSDNSTVTTTGTAVTTTAAGTSIVTTTTTVGDRIETTVTDRIDSTTASSEQAYATRIDQYTKLLDANHRMNETLESDPLTRIKVSATGIQQRDLSGRDYNFYITGNGLKSNANEGYSYNGSVFGLGIEKVINSSTLVGIKYDRGQTTLSGDNAGGNSTKDAVGIYAVKSVNNWIVKGDAGYAMNSYNTAHSIPELGYGNTSSTKGTDKWAQVKLYTPDLKGFRPLVGARVENNQINAVTENGSALTAMSYDAVNQTRTVGLAGARYDYNFNKNWAVGAEATQSTAQTTQANLALTYFDDKNSSVLLKIGTQTNNGVTVNTASVQARLRF